MYRELLIGCGSKRGKDLRLPTAEEINGAINAIYPPKRLGTEFQNLVTLDINRDHDPHILCDLTKVPFYIGDINESCPPGDYFGYNDDGDGDLRFCANSFDEIHAYEVLEHIGAQGDYKLFFAQFSEFWRILKPGGLFFATCPAWCSMWAWGDPSHSRVITSGTLAFLSQREYARQVGHTPMSDFRYLYKADFEPMFVREAEPPNGESLLFVLRAIK